MKIFKRFWPWKRIAELEQRLKDAKLEVEFMRNAHSNLYDQYLKLQDRHDQISKEHAASRNGLRQMAEILTRRGLDKLLLTAALLFLTLTGLSQTILRNNVTTNILGLAPADHALLQSVGGVPGWTTTITAQVQNWSDTVAHIDTNVWPLGVMAWGYDGNRITIGDGSTKGGVIFGVRPLIGGPGLSTKYLGVRQAEVSTSTNWSTSYPAPVVIVDAGNTNPVPAFGVSSSNQGTRATNNLSPMIQFNLGLYGIGSDQATFGLPGFINASGAYALVTGSGGNSISGGQGGNGGTLGTFTMSGGSGGNATNASNLGADGGSGGIFSENGGNGGGDVSGAFSGGGAGGAGGSFNANGGNGGVGGASDSGGQGGAGGSVSLNGTSGLNNDSTAAGGAGGSITANAVSTNTAGSLIMSATASRVGGNITTFGSSYAPMTVFTTTTTAGPSASASEVSLLGTSANLAPPLHQNSGKLIASNVVDHAGRTIRFSMGGFGSTNGTTATLEIKFKIGSTNALDTGPVTLASLGTGNQTWKWEGQITFRTTGSAAQFAGFGSFVTAGNSFLSTNAIVGTVDTTKDEIIDCTAQFNQSDTLQCTTAVLELVN